MPRLNHLAVICEKQKIKPCTACLLKMGLNENGLFYNDERRVKETVRYIFKKNLNT